MRRRRDGTASRWSGGLRLAVVGGAAALVVAGVTGWYPYAQLSPHVPAVTLRPGAEAELAGVRYRLERFEVAPTLPAKDPKDPPAQGPPGSLLVLVVVSQTVLDRSVALDEHYCDATLTEDDGATVWQTDSDFTTLAARPASFGCAGTEESPLRYDVAHETGFSFVVPAAAAGHLSARMAVRDGPTVAFEP
ncbi:hypothetical protein [Microlunatus flavus]|uniref:DUF4352 domain-containing protein n=1 Tax=Microlunatus flavus TaxID=1036181 RepID=A0A1H9FNT9_9ACTN|nr:hypothetical protein [Microlunatus flavus]SEQ39554.1 hypothetical protein SAMN05421756_103332 [Microlunatus flavus]